MPKEASSWVFDLSEVQGPAEGPPGGGILRAASSVQLSWSRSTSRANVPTSPAWQVSKFPPVPGQLWVAKGAVRPLRRLLASASWPHQTAGCVAPDLHARYSCNSEIWFARSVLWAGITGIACIITFNDIGSMLWSSCC
eukprot:3624668-Amphidinium_carterae.2